MLECKQSAQAAFGTAQVRVVTQTRFQRSLHPGLLGIEFPGMDVAHHGQAFAPSSRDPGLGVPERQQAQISAPSGRKIWPTGKTKGRHRELQHSTIRRVYTKRRAWRIGKSVDIVLYGED